LINKIYSNVLRRCAEKGIMIKKSDLNKYIDGLVDLGIIQDLSKFISLED